VWQATQLPADKLLIVGMIDTKTNSIQHPEAIANRLERYANLLGRERVIAATECGFGTTAARTTTVEVDRLGQAAHAARGRRPRLGAPVRPGHHSRLACLLGVE
jgi:5-methyltetrahydropteroyltriglutamate--homocysteine methyltransferase